MSLVSAYSHDNITITGKGSSFNIDGTLKFDGTVQNIRARVLQKTKNVYGSHGVEIEYDYEIWIPHDVTVSEGDRITFNSVNHDVVMIRVGKSIAGATDHKKVFVKRG